PPLPASPPPGPQSPGAAAGLSPGPLDGMMGGLPAASTAGHIPPGVGASPSPALLPPQQPQIDHELIQQLLAKLAPPAPVYPGWFKGPPSRPDTTGVYEVGVRRHEELRPWRQAVY